MGNLASSVTDEVLRQIFVPFGSVAHAVALKDLRTGQARGYGFVHMVDAAAASNAAKGLNGQVSAPPLNVCVSSQGQSSCMSMRVKSYFLQLGTCCPLPHIWGLVPFHQQCILNQHQ